MNSVAIDSRTYRLTGMTPILGSQPANPAVRTQYIGSKAPNVDVGVEESALLPDIEEKGLTVFLRDPDTDALGLLDYTIRGFFKEALDALKEQNGIKNIRKKVDNLLFCEPVKKRAPGDRFIVFTRNGEPIMDEDDQLERSLRADTMQGPRTSLAASEMVNDPWAIEFTLTLLPNRGTAQSKALSWDAVEQALDYGAFKGLGQWRNAGHGRFTWERIDEGAKKPKRARQPAAEDADAEEKPKRGRDRKSVV